jgi:hypothetical protein
VSDPDRVSPGPSAWTGEDGHVTIFAPCEDDAVITVAEIVKRGGARKFEIEWESPLVSEPEIGRQPPAGVPGTWIATVVWRDERPDTVVRFGPTTDHGAGPALVSAELLRVLGVNVQVLDAR